MEEERPHSDKSSTAINMIYRQMDTIQLLILIIAMTPSACSEASMLQCTPLDVEFFNIYKGEAFYFVPYDLDDSNQTDEEITWYKNSSPNETISTNENETVHYHGGALFFLNVSTENSGSYTARHVLSPDSCFTYHVNITAFDKESDEALLYGSIDNSNQNKMMPCPDPVSYTCQVFDGELTWKKDFELLHGHSKKMLWVHNANKDDEGIYTCTCYWTHNNQVYKSSASRRLILKEPSTHPDPEIISPVSKELPVDVGSGFQLSCSALCGMNAESHCNVTWNVSQRAGYTQIYTVNTEPPSNKTISTAVLTIEKVSANDLQTEFKCTAVGFYSDASHTLRLKQRESIVSLLIMGVRVLLLFVSTAVLVKCFAIDLALIFRPYIPFRKHSKDTRIYDAYVIYQTRNLDKTSEDMLSQFVTKNLPSVLEEKCGYRLFIHGRDDLPGEDKVELVEERMKQSKRLMVILTLGSRSGSDLSDHPASLQTSEVGNYDWQMGLHYVLVQREMSVILIQIGETGSEGYAHLSPSLQHLIRERAPIQWRGATSSNSRFWKRVRYLMPSIPARKCPQSGLL